jgi:hypothetical protein
MSGLRFMGVLWATCVFARDATRTYDVIPPRWITASGAPYNLGEDDPPATAFVFPSVYEGATFSYATIGPFAFFDRRNHFKSKPFSWPPLNSPNPIKLTVTRTGDMATLEMDKDSVRLVRGLTWEQFGLFQGAFVHWLFDNSNCGLFVNCNKRFEPRFRRTLISWWKEVLKDATFEEFAEHRLRESVSRSAEIKYEDYGTIGGLKSLKIAMRAQLISAGETLAVAWGSSAVFPYAGAQGVSGGYTRPAVGAISELRIALSRDRLRLLPELASPLLPISQDNSSPGSPSLLPFRAEWAGLIGGNDNPRKSPVFIPIYNMFDLRDKRLLCDDSFSAPPYLFLLTPEHYVKADTGPGRNQIAQYTTDGRTGVEPTGLKANAAAQLARHFLIIGCDTPDSACPAKQLTALLDQAFNATQSGLGPAAAADIARRAAEAAKAASAAAKDSATAARSSGSASASVAAALAASKEADAEAEAALLAAASAESFAKDAGAMGPSPAKPAYAIAVFADQTFVEVRRRVSVNGRPLEASVIDRESWGAITWSWMSSGLDRISERGSPPLLEVRRTVRSRDSETGKFHAETMRLLFHTTAGSVLNQAEVFEGDEFYARPDVQALLR